MDERTSDTVASKQTTLRERQQQRFGRLRRHWLTLAFLFGFVVDNLTLNRVDQVFDNIILATQVTLSMVSILVLYASVSGKLGGKVGYYGAKYAPMVVQYAFGGLLSGMLIFYGRSGDWFASWPFMLVILAAIFGNERIKDRSSRLIYNLAIMFIGMMSYVVLIVPVLTGKMGALVFVFSGLIALLVMYVFIQVLYRVIPRFMQLQTRAIVITIGALYAGFNFFYFANIIPPIPLSLKELGVYHSVIYFNDIGAYQLKWVEAPWWRPLTNSDRAFYPSVSTDAYCFASVFAPTKLHTDIYHVWEYKNQAGDWQQHARLRYPISGGSSRGYRGYTLISNHREGTWRCKVETERGQVLGREVFTIAPADVRPTAAMVTRTE